VTLPAAVDGGGPSLHDLSQDVVQRANELGALGVVAGGELFRLLRVAASAVVGRDDNGNRETVVLEGGRISLLRLVAGVAVHIGLSMGTAPPLGCNPGIHLLVAVQARLPFF
jgi:hypothetical protein